MTYRLRSPLEPLDGESLAGLIARTALEYRLREPRRLLSRLSLSNHVLWTLCDTDPSSDFGTRLRNLLCIDDEALFRRMSPWTGDPLTSRVMGHAVWRELVQPDARAVCPLCLREGIYHRAIWSVSAMPVCAVHKVWLRRKCHECNAPLTWLNSNLHRCARLPRCGGDLREAPAEPAPESSIPAMLALHNLAHQETPSTGATVQTIFAHALRLSFLLGQIAYGFERASRPPGFMQRQAQRLPVIVARGWDALDDWPNGFHRLLDQLRERASERKGKDGLRKAFGTLSTKVHQWAREPWGAPIGEVFANYVASQGDVATTARTLQRYAPGAEIRHMFLTTAEAQRTLGMSGSAILRIAQRRNLFELAPRGAGLPSLIRADVFRQVAAEASDFLFPDEARLELGVGRKVMEQLEAEGLIKRLPGSEVLLETKPFRRSYIRAFVDACVGNPPTLTREAARKRKLSTIIGPTAPGRSVGDICRALMDGRLRAVAVVRHGRGLARARLSLADVDRVLPSSKGTLSLLDAAKQSGFKYEAVSHWVARGLIETIHSDGDEEHGRRLHRETWDSFLSKYVTSGMLAKDIGQTANHWISRHLRFLGVEPVSGEGVDGGTGMLFRRSDVGPAVIKALRRIQKGASGSPQDKHRRSFARVKQAANGVAAAWGATFTRDHNLFVDTHTGRAVQIVSGRRPDLTGVFVFHTRTSSLRALLAQPDPWIALVPNEGERFLLVPAREVPWRGDPDAEIGTRFVTLRFDARGHALELTQWEQLLVPIKTMRAKKADEPRRRRSFDRVIEVATAVEDRWSTKLDRNRNAFVDPVGDRKLHVVCGRPCGGPTKQIFHIHEESFGRLHKGGEGWVALVPVRGPAFLLAKVDQLDWSGEGKDARHVRMRFDVYGFPMDLDGTHECSVLTIPSKDPL